MPNRFRKDDLEFTKASAQDAIEIVKLVNSAYRGDSSRQGWTTEADFLDGQRSDFDSIMEDIEARGSCILMARRKSNHELVGCVLLKTQIDHVYLGMLTVQPALQASGLGTLLLEQSEIHAIEQKRTKIRIRVIGQRPELITWYQKRNYHLINQRNAFPYGDPRFGIPKRDDLYFELLEKELGKI